MFNKNRDPAVLNSATGTAECITEVRHQDNLLKTGDTITRPIRVNEFMEAQNVALEFAATESDGAINP